MRGFLSSIRTRVNETLERGKNNRWYNMLFKNDKDFFDEIASVLEKRLPESRPDSRLSTEWEERKHQVVGIFRATIESANKHGMQIDVRNPEAIKAKWKNENIQFGPDVINIPSYLKL